MSEMSRSLSAVCVICRETVTRLIGVVMPDTTMGMSTLLLSGMVVTVLLLNRTGAAAEPLGRVMGIEKVPLAGVCTTRSKATLVPQTKPGPTLNWKGVVFVPRPLMGMVG